MAIAAHWMISDNFGDRLTPWLIENIRGERPTWVSQTFDAEYYVASGSILNLANEHAKVWGAGLASFNDNVNDRAQIYAVRGPLTRAKALASRAKCPAVYGDPAILLPMFLPKKIEKIHDIGLIPHYVDQFRVFSRYPGVMKLNVFDPIEIFIDQVKSCRRIVSSALHGIIVAHAFGIPAAWVRWGDSIGGDSMKYFDHFAAVGLDVPYPVDRRDNSDDVQLDAFQCPDPSHMENLRKQLWNACPFRRS